MARIVLLKPSLLPIAGFAVKVHDRYDRDKIRSMSKQDSKRKGFGETTTDISLDQREQFGIYLNPV